MKPIKPIYIQRNNRPEKTAGIILLVIVASILLLVKVASAQTPGMQKAIYKASVIKGTGKEDGAIVSWSIAASKQCNFFQVERSFDKVHYELVYIVQNVGNSNSTGYFTATDYSPALQTTYYRISALNAAGQPTHLYELKYQPEAVKLTQK